MMKITNLIINQTKFIKIMKCFKTLAYVSMAALVSVAGFTSCSSEEELNAPKTTAQQAEGEYNGEEVKTEFSISLPGNAVRQNMPGATVQAAGTLASFQGMTNITLVPFAKQSAIASTDTRLGNANITLSDIAATTTDLGANSNAKVYTNVSIPLTTASFLFYGESAKTGTAFEKGSLTAAISSASPADYSFSLAPILDAITAPTAVGSKGEALIAYLNAVAQASDGTTEWRNYTAAESAAMTAMFETYSSNHSLSSFQVQRIMTDLYKSLMPLNTAIATAIKAAIAPADGSAGTYASVNTTTGVVTLNSALAGFPANHNIPEGSVRVKYAGSAPNMTFQPCVAADYTSANNTPLDKYTYPSSLWYYVNSTINTSNQSQKDKYNASNSWATILGYHTDAAAVNSLTRAVAITNTIQYAVARLDVTVKLEAGTLDDNTPVTAKSITCASYPVTAVLVGGQKNVGFDFTPKGTDAYTIYDNVMTSSTMAATTTASAANSTLVLETEAGANKDVMIAVELENASGEDFIGVGGQLIPAGSKFYVIAQLVSDDANVTGKRVFKQDYVTTANLTLKSLKAAYNTIPDLRTPELELGFSVDLTWQAGKTYDVDIN